MFRIVETLTMDGEEATPIIVVKHYPTQAALDVALLAKEADYLRHGWVKRPASSTPWEEIIFDGDEDVHVVLSCREHPTVLFPHA